MHATDRSLLYMHVYYTSDSYSQFGVDVDLVGVGSLKGESMKCYKPMYAPV